jgi:hypothetical protein
MGFAEQGQGHYYIHVRLPTENEARQYEQAATRWGRRAGSATDVLRIERFRIGDGALAVIENDGVPAWCSCCM